MVYLTSQKILTQTEQTIHGISYILEDPYTNRTDNTWYILHPRISLHKQNRQYMVYLTSLEILTQTEQTIHGISYILEDPYTNRTDNTWYILHPRRSLHKQNRQYMVYLTS